MTDNQNVMDDKSLVLAIDALLQKADAEIAAQNWEAANKLIKQALAELGDRYFRTDVLESSGMKLIAADISEKDGKFETAVRARRRILAGRLESLKSKIQ